MSKGYENFNNSETAFRKSSLIQERIGLVSTHMYKQFLDYQHATMNTTEIFSEMINNLKAISDSLKQSFSSRGITTENIFVESDKEKSVAVINILWHTISFTTRCNFEPQALFREGNTPMFSGRIMAINGNYNELTDSSISRSDMMSKLLDKEVASLYVPADKSQNSIFKIRHLSNREFFLNSSDASREFVLKVIETICGGGLYHEEGSRKSFNI
ncbi:MAG: hypothetical protein MJ230_07345 [bacterium]|nr:hypothetical protein [bacterium]